MPHQERAWSWFDEGVKAFKNNDLRFARTCFNKCIQFMKEDLGEQGVGPGISRITREFGEIIFSDYCPDDATKSRGLIFLADLLKEQNAHSYFFDKLIAVANELDQMEQNQSSRDRAAVLQELSHLFGQMRDQL